METTDTTNQQFGDKEIPDGKHEFKVLEVKKKFGGKDKDTPFYIWRLNYPGGQGEQVLLPSMMGPLLRILGCKETEPNKFLWDTDDQKGKYFFATVSREPDKKDPSKMRQKMGHFEPSGKAADIPF